MLNTFISYNGLPISAGGAHALNRRSIKENYQKIIDFLNEYANTNKPQSLQLIFTPGGLTVQIVRKWLTFTRMFGIPVWDFWNPGRPWGWNVTAHKYERAMQIVDSFKEDSLQGATLVLSLYWHFHLVNPKTGIVLPMQDEIPEIDFRIRNSRFYLRLGEKSTVSAWLAFPFDLQSEPYEGYLRNLCAKLPFKPSGRHWRLWTRMRSGNWIARIIEPNF